MKYVLLDIRTEREMGKYPTLEGSLGLVREELAKGSAKGDNLVLAQYSEADELLGIIGNHMLRVMAGQDLATV